MNQDARIRRHAGILAAFWILYISFSLFDQKCNETCFSIVLNEILSLLFLISNAALLGCVFFAAFAKFLRPCASAVLVAAAVGLVAAAADVRVQGCDLS